MESILINKYGRMRSGWRAVLFLFAFIFFVTGWQILGHILTTVSTLGINRNGLLFSAMSWSVLLLIAVVLSWVCGKLLEGLPIKTLGWALYKGWWRDLALGAVVGVATLGLACLICYAAGGVSFSLNDSAGTTAIGLTLFYSGTIFFLGAAFEETLYRGYLLQTFARANLAWLAIILTSAFFAWAHMSNPSFNAIAMINTLLAGLWFAAAYLRTRSLWLPFSAHFFWNWFQGAFFGIPVSGITSFTTAPVLVYSTSGPEWLTGGGYGIEGGLACTVAILISTILIWFVPGLKADEEMLALPVTNIRQR